MMRRAALFILLSAFALAVSGAVFFIVWQSLTRERIEREVIQKRSRVERFIGLERWNDAFEILEGVTGAEFPHEAAWIPFIRQARRAEALLEDTGELPDYAEIGDGELSIRLAEAAVDAVPDSGRLRALYTLVLLEAGRREEASEQARMLPEGEFPSIHAELWLHGYREDLPSGSSAAAHIVRAIDTRDVESLREAWRATGSVVFGHNAVLEALASGDRVEAGRILEELPADERVARLGFLFEVERALAGNEGARDNARRWLEQLPAAMQGNPSILLARTDLAALDGDQGQRELLLADALAAGPDYSAVPYLALSELSATQADAIRWLRQGLQVLEGNVDIAINLAAVLRDVGDHEASIEVLSQTKDARAGDEDERLALAWVLSNPDFSPERRRTSLWQLLERFPESQQPAGEVTSRTARSGDRSGLEILRSHSGVQEAGWRHGVDAALAVSRGQRAEAVAAFDDVEPDTWNQQYNYALALLFDRQYGSASRAFESAIEKARTQSAASSDLAAIYVRAGETALLRRNSAQAREYAGRALEHEPSMVRARLLWRITGE